MSYGYVGSVVKSYGYVRNVVMSYGYVRNVVMSRDYVGRASAESLCDDKEIVITIIIIKTTINNIIPLLISCGARHFL